MPAVVRDDGSLNDAAITLLHAVSGVDAELIRAARIRPSRSNWLRAPWYRHHRGGAITVGRTIWFTRIWWLQNGRGDGSLASTWHWLLLLAHEVGHLPQAEHFGRDFFGKARYVAAFAWQYGSRAVLMKNDVHDGARMEREAELGRWVLVRVLGDQGEAHAMVAATASDDLQAVREWCSSHAQAIASAQTEYRKRFLAR